MCKPQVWPAQGGASKHAANPCYTPGPQLVFLLQVSGHPACLPSAVRVAPLLLWLTGPPQAHPTARCRETCTEPGVQAELGHLPEDFLGLSD